MLTQFIILEIWSVGLKGLCSRIYERDYVESSSDGLVHGEEKVSMKGNRHLTIVIKLGMRNARGCPQLNTESDIL